MRKILQISLFSIGLSGCLTSPTPLTTVQMNNQAHKLFSKIYTTQAVVKAPISLYEAMARTLKYNLDHRVKLMEIDLARADYDLSSYQYLPQIVASGTYFGRNNDPGASSLSLLSGRQSLEPSTSSERDVFTGDLKVSWNVLDFGLSKIRSQQLSDEILIYEEYRRKAIVKIIEDVTHTYWRAISAQRLETQLRKLEREVRMAFQQSRQLYIERQTPPMAALSYQRELNDIQAQAQALSRELKLAKLELAALMALPPTQEYTLVQMPELSIPQVLDEDISLPDMMIMALKQRPEIRESAYAKRISERELQAATLEAYPSLEGFLNVNISSNDFLFNQNWLAYGAHANWNILQLFSTPTRKRKANAHMALEEQKTLAMALAVMTQVGVACTHYQALTRAYKTSQTGIRVQDDILKQIEALYASGSTSAQTLVRERMNSLLAQARRDTLQAELQLALTQVYTAMGFDPYGANISGQEDIHLLAQNLQILWKRRQDTFQKNTQS